VCPSLDVGVYTGTPTVRTVTSATFTPAQTETLPYIQTETLPNVQLDFNLDCRRRRAPTLPSFPSPLRLRYVLASYSIIRRIDTGRSKDLTCRQLHSLNDYLGAGLIWPPSAPAAMYLGIVKMVICNRSLSISFFTRWNVRRGKTHNPSANALLSLPGVDWQFCQSSGSGRKARFTFECCFRSFASHGPDGESGVCQRCPAASAYC
jgi:hypothetical protein